MRSSESYIAVYDWMVEATHGAHVLVYALIYGYCSECGGTCSLSRSYISRRTGLSEGQVERYVTKLVEQGLITYTPGAYKGTRSTFTLKGVQNNPLSDGVKGYKMTPFEGNKGVQNSPLKGVQNDPLNNKDNNNYIYSQKEIEEKEKDPLAMARAWLTDNEEHSRVLCMNNGIEMPDDDPTKALAPYIDEFLRREEENETDWYVETRTGTRQHFANWLRIYVKQNTNNNGNNTKGHTGTTEDGPERVVQEFVRVEFRPDKRYAWRNRANGLI